MVTENKGHESCAHQVYEGDVDHGAEKTSIENALAAVGVGAQQLGIFLYVGGCWMSDAMEVMLVAVLAPAVGCEWGTSPEGQSLLASSVFTGMMLASSAWGIVADLAGRKVAFGTAAGLAASAGLASAFAPSFIWLLVLRLLVGCGLVGVLPMYTLLEEWLPRGSGNKGKWLVALQVWWSIGTVLEALLAMWLLNAYGWRALLAASSIPLACILAVLPWVPESPHYLATAGRFEEARCVLVAAAAYNGTTERLKQHLLCAPVLAEETLPTTGHQQQGAQQADDHDAEAEPLGGSSIVRDAIKDAGCERSLDTPAEMHLEVEIASELGPDEVRPVSCGECCCCCSGGGADDGSGTSDAVCDSCDVQRRACPSRIRICCCNGAAATSAGASAVLGWCCQLAALGRILLGPQLVDRTWRLAIAWFACALSYYGVVMLVPWIAASSLRERNNGNGSAVPDGDATATGSCTPWPQGDTSHLVLPRAAYVSMMAAAAAELPSLAWAFMAVDRWSRRNVVALSLTATAAALAPIVMAQAAAEKAPLMMPPPPPDLTPAAAGTHISTAGTFSVMRQRRLHPAWLASPEVWWLPLASVLLARLFVSGAFTLLYILTPEQYPPRVHGSALGAANTLARLGALAAPFVAVALPQHGELPAALGFMAAACCAAALAVGSLRGKKCKGMSG